MGNACILRYSGYNRFYWQFNNLNFFLLLGWNLLVVRNTNQYKYHYAYLLNSTDGPGKPVNHRSMSDLPTVLFNFFFHFCDTNSETGEIAIISYYFHEILFSNSGLHMPGRSCFSLYRFLTVRPFANTWNSSDLNTNIFHRCQWKDNTATHVSLFCTHIICQNMFFASLFIFAMSNHS